jgi:hypothetical protein
MKKTIGALMVVAIFSQFNLVTAQNTKDNQVVQTEVNSVAIGYSLLEQDLAYFNIYWSYRKDSGELVRMEGTMNKDAWVTSLDVDDKFIWGTDDNPLPGVLYPAEGVMNNVEIYLSGRTPDGDWFGSGRASYDVLYPGDSVKIVFDPGSHYKNIKILGESGDRLYIDGDWVGSYSTYSGGFDVHVNMGQSKGNYSYEVFNKDGEKVDAGYLDQFFNVIPEDPPSPTLTFSAIEIAGGVEELNAYTSGQFYIDGNAYNDEESSVEAKVFVADLSVGAYMSISNFETAELYYKESSGTLRLWKTLDPESYGYAYENFAPSDRKILVVVYDSDGEFYLFFNPKGEIKAYSPGGGKG